MVLLPAILLTPKFAKFASPNRVFAGTGLYTHYTAAPYTKARRFGSSMDTSKQIIMECREDQAGRRDTMLMPWGPNTLYIGTKAVMISLFSLH